MISKTTVAEPRAVANVSSSGRALPREKLPKIMAKKTVTTSPADISQARIRVEPYLQGRHQRSWYTITEQREVDLPEPKSIC